MGMNEETVIGFRYHSPTGVLVCVKVNHQTGELWFIPSDEYERRFLSPEANP